MIPQPEPWMDRALCTGLVDLFFPPVGGESRWMVRQAKAVCAQCPVREECLEHALTKPEPFGVWGGTSERERRQMRRDEGITTTRAERATCGTDSGYYRHRYFKEPTCADCRKAHSQAESDRLRRKRMGAA